MSGYIHYPGLSSANPCCDEAYLTRVPYPCVPCAARAAAKETVKVLKAELEKKHNIQLCNIEGTPS